MRSDQLCRWIDENGSDKKKDEDNKTAIVSKLHDAGQIRNETYKVYQKVEGETWRRCKGRCKIANSILLECNSREHFL